MDHEQLSALTGFEWDDGNSEKNWAKHRVTRSECEQIFFNMPLITADDRKHSQREQRYYALGQTEGARVVRGVHDPECSNPCNLCPGYESGGEKGT